MTEKPPRKSRAKKNSKSGALPDGAQDEAATAPLQSAQVEQGRGGDPAPDEAPENFGAEAGEPGAGQEPPAHVTEGPDEAPDSGEQPFKVLGYNNGVYYYFPRRKKQVVALTAAQHKIENLVQLCPDLEWWKNTYSKNMRKLAVEAAADLIGKAQDKGVFIQEGALRGTGCWLDDNRIVLHCGGKLIVNGEEKKLEDIDSEFVYVGAARLLDKPVKPLTNHEAAKFRKLCEAPSWENDLSGTLLAGWCVIAPVCSALAFRPHLFIMGESDAGKSWVQDNITRPALGRFGAFMAGGATEPWIREVLGYDGRPIIYDEGGGEHSKYIMLGVIELARKATDGRVVGKRGQKPFKAQFCGCFSAVHPTVNRVEDENRFAFLRILKNKNPSALQDFEDIQALAAEVMTPDFSARLMARTIENFFTLQQNIKTFTRAARIVLKAARSSQVIGTMLAGAYLLGRREPVTPDEAEAWIKKHKWDDFMPASEDNEPMRLVQHICSSLIRYSSNTGEVSIGDLIGQFIEHEDNSANKILRQYGIKVVYDGVIIGDRSPNLARLLKDTDWAARWNRMLAVIPGAIKISNDYFMRGVKMNGVKLPLDMFKSEQHFKQQKFL